MAARVITCTGAQVGAHLDSLARLRIRVFRDYPYLYDGDMAYEQRYLQAYARSAGSVFVLALDGDDVVGCSTGIPLVDETPAIREPFEARGFRTDDVFYFGESVLLPSHRGQGIGHRFFDLREAHARSLGGFRWTAFCAVERAPDDPRSPPGHRANDVFWQKRGYRRQDEMFCTLDWTEVGATAPSTHRLRFWLRPLGD
ncbi:MAG TPA: GNAT family N-acetyltransferase [Dyella sp.]|uniref:GNAT family N-acetyltransferase n=1 Tax=Dyella sp. TaxID=1869338 RepID=UPI002D791DDA|nr:GNAT family N-acetyltransferase [Dyella sp.]HET6554883.1 GNAT family N-acetyltransferase [Dyella sp.]